MSFVLPEGIPRAGDVFDSVSAALPGDPSVPPDLLAAAQEYVGLLKSRAIVSPVVTTEQAALEGSRHHAAEAKLALLLTKHGLDPSLVSRFRRPSGSVYSIIAALLFWPPASNRPGERYVLVYGPDTTTRMLRQGCTEAQYTRNLYSFVTPIIRGKQFSNKPFTADESLTKEAARDIWKVLSADAREDYAFRAVRPGVDIVYGSPVKGEWTKAVNGIGDKWEQLLFTANIAVPGVNTDVGSWPAGTHPFTGCLFYRYKLDGSIEFGKLTIFSVHPCTSGAKLAQGSSISLTDWRNSVFLDALVDLQIYCSTGLSALRTPVHTFTFVARPCPQLDLTVDCFTVASWRHYEKEAGVHFSEEELPDGVVAYIKRHYDIPSHDVDPLSYLTKACSASTLKGHDTKRATPSLLYPGLNVLQEARKTQDETLGEDGRKARAKKANENLGEDGRKARAKKGNETLGEDGRKTRRKKQLENMGTEGQLDRNDVHKATTIKNGGRAPRIDPYPSIHPKMVEIERLITEYKEKNGGLKSVARANVIAKLRSDLVGGANSNFSSLLDGWHPQLPYNLKDLLSDEQMYVGVQILLGIIVAKKSKTSSSS